MMANRYFVIVGLFVGGSAAHAGPSHRNAAANAKAGAEAQAPADADSQKQLADAEEEAAPEDIAPPPRRTAPAPGWQIAVGPFEWASAIQANVAFGPLTTGVDIGFISLVRHTRYGAEVMLEARHGRFGITGEITYGAAAFAASTEIASVMTTISGSAASLMVDSAVGYEVLGDDTSRFSIEARSGLRYQRNTVQGELGAAGITVQTPEIVDAGADVVVGARAVVRPARWLQVAGMFDYGVVGASDSTWSTALDASVRMSDRVLVTAGWRSLTMRRASVTIEMAGPRLAAQLVF